MTVATEEFAALPDMKVSIRQVFGIDSDMEIPAYSEADEHVPDGDVRAGEQGRPLGETPLVCEVRGKIPPGTYRLEDQTGGSRLATAFEDGGEWTVLREGAFAVGELAACLPT